MDLPRGALGLLECKGEGRMRYDKLRLEGVGDGIPVAAVVRIEGVGQ